MFKRLKKAYIAIGVLLLILGVVGGYLSANTSRLKPSAQNHLDEQIKNKHLFCTEQDCLYYNSETGATEGFAVLKGYYKEYNEKAWGTGSTCDSLVVTGGSDELINNFKDLISMGNSVNRYDENNNLLINLDMTKLDLALKQKMLLSSVLNPVELGVLRETGAGRDAPVCGSFIKILYVK